jgi:hypothetical protein
MSHSARSNEVEEFGNVKDVEQRNVNSYHTDTLLMPSNANSMGTGRTAPVSEENFLDLVDQKAQNPMEVS